MEKFPIHPQDKPNKELLQDATDLILSIVQDLFIYDYDKLEKQTIAKHLFLVASITGSAFSIWGLALFFMVVSSNDSAIAFSNHIQHLRNTIPGKLDLIIATWILYSSIAWSSSVYYNFVKRLKRHYDANMKRRLIYGDSDETHSDGLPLDFDELNSEVTDMEPELYEEIKKLSNHNAQES